jgi:hypothetical protein
MLAHTGDRHESRSRGTTVINRKAASDGMKKRSGLIGRFVKTFWPAMPRRCRRQ